MALGPKTPKIF